MPACSGGQLSNGPAALWGELGGSRLPASGGGFEEFSLKLGDAGDREEAGRLDPLGAFLLRCGGERLEGGEGVRFHGHNVLMTPPTFPTHHEKIVPISSKPS